MIVVYFFLLCILLFLCIGHAHSSIYPVCASMAYTANNFIDIKKILQNCTQTIPTSVLPPSYFTYDVSNSGPTLVNTSVAVNTLINVDDITAQVTIDVYLRTYWTDERIHLPNELWSSLKPAVRKEGLEITPFIRDSASPLPIWLPDIQIMETVSSEVVSELIHLFPNGTIFWSRHMLLTLTQAQMDLHRYPRDSQMFLLSLQSFAYSADFVHLQPIGESFILFNNNPSLDTLYVDLNRLWGKKASNAMVRKAHVPIFYNTERHYSTLTIEMIFERKSYGIIFRLAIPVAIFMIIVCYSFWIQVEKRIDISVTMLLVTAALYGAIGQIIPLVGYFTSFDSFIMTGILTLSVAILMHYAVYLLHQYQNAYPMMIFVKNVVELTGRVCCAPVATFMMLYYFRVTEPIAFGLLIAASAITVIYGFITFPHLIIGSFWSSYDDAKELHENVTNASKQNATQKGKASDENKTQSNQKSSRTEEKNDEDADVTVDPESRFFQFEGYLLVMIGYIENWIRPSRCKRKRKKSPEKKNQKEEKEGDVEDEKENDPVIEDTQIVLEEQRMIDYPSNGSVHKRNSRTNSEEKRSQIAVEVKNSKTTKNSKPPKEVVIDPIRTPSPSTINPPPRRSPPTNSGSVSAVQPSSPYNTTQQHSNTSTPNRSVSPDDRHRKIEQLMQSLEKLTRRTSGESSIHRTPNNNRSNYVHNRSFSQGHEILVNDHAVAEDDSDEEEEYPEAIVRRNTPLRPTDRNRIPKQTSTIRRTPNMQQAVRFREDIEYGVQDGEEFRM
jgi:hypothetical protein